MRWDEIKKLVDDNAELQEMEEIGWKKGAAKGKTMECCYVTIMLGLEKQINDLKYHLDVHSLEEDPAVLIDARQAVADVRNVAGCLFLKLQEFERVERARERRLANAK